ncbi:MAG: acyltransferase [Nitrospirota bacterium]
MEKNNRFYEIDLLRFFAALSVVAYHYTFLGFAGDRMSVSYAHFAPVSKYGYLGVNLFFIISGFVILNTALRKSPKNFLISRFVRLYPGFWVCCSLTLMAMLVAGGAHTSLAAYLVNMTLLNEFVGVKSIDNVYWSLSYEIVFYALIFSLLVFGRISKIKIFLGLWLLFSLLFYAVNPDKFQYIRFVLLPNYSAYFIAGAVFFLINSEGLDLYKAFLLIGSYFLALIYSNEYLKYLTENYHTHFNLSVVAVCLAAFYLIFYLISTNKTKIISSPKFAAIGLLTYPLYLLHQNIGIILFNTFGGVLNKYALLSIIFLFVLFLSYIVSSKVEKALAGPFKRWLEKPFGLIEDYAIACKKKLFKTGEDLAEEFVKEENI